VLDSSYPTTKEIHTWLSNTKITSQQLSINDIKSLLDRLKYDNQIISIPSTFDDQEMWFSIKNPIKTNGFAESVCGQCDVFEFCNEDGPINPSNCIYFKDFLDFYILRFFFGLQPPCITGVTSTTLTIFSSGTLLNALQQASLPFPNPLKNTDTPFFNSKGLHFFNNSMVV
jgi:hypothetical protein